MKTFKNKNFKKRDYEATNIVACQSEKAPNDSWIESDDSALGGLSPLWIETINGSRVQFFGWL